MKKVKGKIIKHRPKVSEELKAEFRLMKRKATISVIKASKITLDTDIG